MEYKITCEKVKGKLLSMPSIAIDGKVKYYAYSFIIPVSDESMKEKAKNIYENMITDIAKNLGDELVSCYYDSRLFTDPLIFPIGYVKK